MDDSTNRWMKWETWFHGLIAAAIGGAASAITTQTGLATGQTAGLDMHPLNLKSLAVVAGTSAMVSAAFYLKQSPLPALSQTITKTVAVQETTVQTKTVDNNLTPPEGEQKV
jgi:hypothetical protein